MPDLKQELIRLGSTNPELRPHIRKVLAAGELSPDLSSAALDAYRTSEKALDKVFDKHLSNLPKGYKVKDKSIFYVIQRTMRVVGVQVGYWLELEAEATQDEVEKALVDAGFDGRNDNEMVIKSTGKNKWEVNSKRFDKLSK